MLMNVSFLSSSLFLPITLMKTMVVSSSLNGLPSEGCLSYSFGLAVGSWMTNLMGGALGIIAFVYGYRKSSNDDKEDLIAN